MLTAVLIFLRTFWKPIAIVLVVGGLLFYTYEKGVTHGKEICEEKHLLIEQKRDETVNAKIDKLASGSIEIANANKASAAAINSQIAKLSKDIKNPVVIYKDGKCLPTEQFVGTFNSINGKANEKN